MHAIRSVAVALISSALLFSCGTPDPVVKTPDLNTADLEALKGSTEIIQAVFVEEIRHVPSYAVSVGDRSVDAQLDDLSPAEFTKYYARQAKLAEKLKTLDATRLSAAEQFGFDIATTTVNGALARRDAKTELWEVSNLNDSIDNLSFIPQSQSVSSQAEFDALVARYQKFPTYLTQRLANLESGASQNLTASKDVVQAMLDNVTGYYGLKAADGSPFATLVFGDAVTPADQEKWTAAISTVVDQTLVPAFATFADGITAKILPKARATYGYGALGTVGAKFYESQIAYHTGSTQTAEQLHQLGLTRVAELETAMKAGLATVGINEPTLAAGLAKLAELPESKPAATTELKPYVEDFVATLGKDTWSKTVFGVASPAAPSLSYPPTAGSPYYVIGASTIAVPTETATLVGTPSVLVHEYTHYLQDVVAATGPAPVSKYLSLYGGGALTEGVAHYAETLARSSALYDRPTARETALVKLSADSSLMLRAVRLVLDTGIHTKDWSRQTALDYLTSHVAISPATAAFEVDRYASWPGQALGYRLGMEGIKTQSDRAKAALGSKFNDAAYNKLVLSLTGASLRLLEARTSAFIANPPN